MANIHIKKDLNLVDNGEMRISKGGTIFHRGDWQILNKMIVWSVGQGVWEIGIYTLLVGV